MNDRERVQARLTIPETISTNAIEALMKNYPHAQDAFMEIIDNAVDNRIEKKTLIVRVRVSKDELSVSNTGGEGLDLVGLGNYFTWGHSNKVGKIGQFGVGGKAAMGSLGRGMEITCSANGSDKEYTVSDPAWETREEGLKSFRATESKTSEIDGYFKVRIIGVKKEVSTTALSTKLSDVYRPLILDGSVEIFLNNRKIEPLHISYLESDPNLTPQRLRLQTRLDDMVDLKIGVLEEGQHGLKPGLRCYYRGRLIQDGEFFGNPGPAKIPGTSRLIGEVLMDRVPVTANKSSFDQSSAEYRSVSERLHDVVAKWVDKASKLRPTQETVVGRDEQALAQRVKRIMEHVAAETELLTFKDLPGRASGRMPPEPREPRLEPLAHHEPAENIEGRTAPRLPATGERVKRWGLTHEIVVRAMGNEETRSEIIDENQKKILVINADYPTYQLTKMLGAETHQIYMADTMALELCKIVAGERSVEEFYNQYNKMTVAFGRIFRSEGRRKK